MEQKNARWWLHIASKFLLCDTVTGTEPRGRQGSLTKCTLFPQALMRKAWMICAKTPSVSVGKSPCRLCQLLRQSFLTQQPWRLVALRWNTRPCQASAWVVASFIRACSPHRPRWNACHIHLWTHQRHQHLLSPPLLAYSCRISAPSAPAPWQNPSSLRLWLRIGNRPPPLLLQRYCRRCLRHSLHGHTLLHGYGALT